MVDQQSNPLEPVAKTCATCGATFTCGAATGSCWCAALPRVMRVPPSGGGDCLCPACVRAAIDRNSAAAAVSSPEKQPSVETRDH